MHFLLLLCVFLNADFQVPESLVFFKGVILNHASLNGSKWAEEFLIFLDLSMRVCDFLCCSFGDFFLSVYHSLVALSEVEASARLPLRV